MVHSDNRRLVCYVIFALLLAIQVGIIVYWGSQKAGFYIDELWSYGLANGLFQPSIYANDALLEEWVGSDFFNSYLVVDPGESFRYDSVFDNLANDAHPPLFFCVLHTISSLFPGTFSKWYGIIPNIVFFVGGQIALFRLASRLLGNRYLALIPCAAWGFSCGAISYTLFIRMYMLCIMFVLICANVLYAILEEKKTGFVIWISLFAAMFLGFMTHYFFFIFAFFVSLFAVMVLLFSKRPKALFQYAGTMLVALLAVRLVFPAAYANLIGNSYSTDALSGSSAHGLKRKIFEFAQGTWDDLFFGRQEIAFAVIGLVLLCCIVVAIGALSTRNKNRFGGNVASGGAFVLVQALASVCFLAIAVYCAPWVSTRYTCIVYPLLILCSVWVLLSAIRLIVRMCARESRQGNNTLACAWSIALIVALLLPSVLIGYQQIRYLYLDADTNLEAVEESSANEAIMIMESLYRPTSKLLELTELDRVHMACQEDCNKTRQMKENLPTIDAAKADKILVYIDVAPLSGRKVETDNILEAVTESLDMTGYRHLDGYTLYGDGSAWDVYEVYR